MSNGEIILYNTEDGVESVDHAIHTTNEVIENTRRFKRR